MATARANDDRLCLIIPFIPRRFFVCDLVVPGADASSAPPVEASTPSAPAELPPLPGGQTGAALDAPPVVRVAGPLEEASFRPFRLTGREYVARDFLQLTFALPSESEARGPADSWDWPAYCGLGACTGFRPTVVVRQKTFHRDLATSKC